MDAAQWQWRYFGGCRKGGGIVIDDLKNCVAVAIVNCFKPTQRNSAALTRTMENIAAHRFATNKQCMAAIHH